MSSDFFDKNLSLINDQDLTAKSKELMARHVKNLPVPRKIEFAVKGNKEVRGILVTDSNKVVAKAVVTSPKVTEEELILFSSSPKVNVEVLRYIAGNNQMTKNRNVLSALCNNPRTPVGIVIKFLPKLDVRELTLLSTNKNISATVTTHARRFLALKKR